MRVLELGGGGGRLRGRAAAAGEPAAYRVADLDQEMQRLTRLGARFLQDAPTPGRAGTRVAFLHPRWGAGTLIELVEHPAPPATE